MDQPYTFTLELLTKKAPTYPIRALISVINILGTGIDQVTMRFTSTSSDGKKLDITKIAAGKNIVYDLGLNTAFKEPVTISVSIRTLKPAVSIEKVLALREYSLNSYLFPAPFASATTSIFWFRSYYSGSTAGDNKAIEPTNQYKPIYDGVSSS